MRTLVIGDIHGRFNALKQVLSKSKFDYNKDKLIILGDVVDGGKNTKEVIEELLKIKNKVFVLGNHDKWFLDYIKYLKAESIWINQGGRATFESYGGIIASDGYIIGNTEIIKNCFIPKTHIKFFENYVLYHEEVLKNKNNMIFVHGGFDPNFNPVQIIDMGEENSLLWDRHLIQIAKQKIIPNYDKVFVGHTTTQPFYKEYNDIKGNKKGPIKFNNLIMMDCGGGWNGRLAIMNIETEEYWLSDLQEPVYR